MNVHGRVNTQSLAWFLMRVLKGLASVFENLSTKPF